MLASRLLTILMLLQTRGRMGASQLAKEFEVSVRTIHRDIDQLSAAGVPVYADRGRSGGFALMDGYRTKLTGMTEPEAEAVFLTGLPGPAAQLGLADTLAAARLKLTAALPASMQPSAERIASRFHLDPTTWFRGADPLPSLQPVARAVWSGHYVKLNYRASKDSEPYARKLGPLGLVLKGGTWYLVAQSGKALRTYRVGLISDAVVTDEPFKRPKTFDLAAHWEESSRAYESNLYREQADIRVSQRGLDLLELLGPYVTEAAAKTGKRDKQGWTRCSVPIESHTHAVREFLRLGDDIEVLAPAALRERLVDTLQQTAKRYRR
jgi:predicted DNA-binding transcriptional regulator YafY